MYDMWKRLFFWKTDTTPHARGAAVRLTRFGRSHDGIVVDVVGDTLLWAGVTEEAGGGTTHPLGGGRGFVRSEMRLWNAHDTTIEHLDWSAPPEVLRMLRWLPRVTEVTRTSDLQVGDILSWKGGQFSRCVVADAGANVAVMGLADGTNLAKDQVEHAWTLQEPERAGTWNVPVIDPTLHLLPADIVHLRFGRLGEADMRGLDSMVQRYSRLEKGTIVEARDQRVPHWGVLSDGLLVSVVPVVDEQHFWEDVRHLGKWFVVGAPRLLSTTDVLPVADNFDRSVADSYGRVLSDGRKSVVGGVYLLTTKGSAFARAVVLRKEPSGSAARVAFLSLDGDNTLEAITTELRSVTRVNVVSTQKGLWSEVGSIDLGQLPLGELSEAIQAATREATIQSVGEEWLEEGTVVRSHDRNKLHVVWEDQGENLVVTELVPVVRNLSPVYAPLQRYSTTGSADPVAVSGELRAWSRDTFRDSTGSLSDADMLAARSHLQKNIQLPSMSGKLPRGTIVVANFFHPATKSESIGTYVVWGDLDDVRNDETVDSVSALIVREKEREGHHPIQSSPLSGHDSDLWVWPHPVRIIRGKLLRVQGMLSPEDIAALEDTVTVHLRDMVVPGRILWAPVEFTPGTPGKIRPLVVTRVEGENATTLVLSASMTSPLSDMRTYTLQDTKTAELGRKGKINDTRVMVHLRHDEFLLGRYLSQRDLQGARALEERTAEQHPVGTLPWQRTH